MPFSDATQTAMRLAYVVYQFPCLSESFILDQIVGMREAGHDVRIYSGAEPSDDPVDPRVAAHRLIERTRYLPRLARTWPGLVRQAGHALVARSGQSGRSVAGWKGSIRESLRSLAMADRFVWPGVPKFDIVHYQFGCVAKSLFFGRSFWRAKLVVSFRGHDFSVLPRQQGPDMYREVFREVDAVTVVCRYAVPKLIALGCPPEKLIVHHSGTDVDEFTFRERFSDSKGELHILTVARLEEAKGIEFALRAVAELIHRHRMDVRYGIVGGGSLDAELRNLVTELGIGDRVTFHGPKARPEVRDLLRQHHVFLLPSVTDRHGCEEGIPGSVREAMASGMPVVSTLHSGIPELVEDGVSGFLVPERDVEALTERLHELATHPERWTEMGRRGREQIERKFEIRQLNRRLDAFYQHLLAGGVPAEFDGGATMIGRAPQPVGGMQPALGALHKFVGR